MSTFAVTVMRLGAVEPHPNADLLDLAVVGDYRCVVGKAQYKAGDLIAYIPEASILSEAVLTKLNLKDSSLLAGKTRDRVKAIRLRGALSQGICYPAEPGWTEGQDVADLLGVTKWTPPIPTHMQGEIANVGPEFTVRYDIENVKWFAGAIAEGEPVVMTEKLHGTWTQIGVLPAGQTAHSEVGEVVVSSKGHADKGLAFKDNEANAGNIYCRVARSLGIRERVRKVQAMTPSPLPGNPVYILGETLGVQDLKYGTSTEKDETIGFRIFDVYMGVPLHGQGRYLDDAELDAVCVALGIPRVPVLYRGPYSKAAMLEMTSGKETVSGKALHLREGTVVRPVVERQDFAIYDGARQFPCNGRVQVKSVSADYDLRKGANGEEPSELQ